MRYNMVYLTIFGLMALPHVSLASNGKGIFVEATGSQSSSQMSGVDLGQGISPDQQFLTGISQASTKKGPNSDVGGCGSAVPVTVPVEGCGN